MRKGYTLIELIGVISIISILSVTISLAISNTVDRNRDKTNVITIKELVDVVKENKINNMIFTSITVNITNKVVSYTYQDNTYNVTYEGRKINNGKIIINSDGTYEIPFIEVDNYCYNKTLSGDITHISECDNNCSGLID